MIVAIEEYYYTKDDYIDRVIGVFDEADLAIRVIKEFYDGVVTLHQVVNDWDEDGPCLVYKDMSGDESVQVSLREFKLNQLSYVHQF